MGYPAEWVPVVGPHAEESRVGSYQRHQAGFVSLNVQLELVLWFVVSALIRHLRLDTHTRAKSLSALCLQRDVQAQSVSGTSHVVPGAH